MKPNVLQELDSLMQSIVEKEFKKPAQAAGKEKMTCAFSIPSGFFDGYCLAWPDGNGGVCRVFNQSRAETDIIFATLASKMVVEKYRIRNGLFKKIA